MKEKPWPKTGDRYYFVDLNLNVGHGTVTDDIYSEQYERQRARCYAGNFFQTFEEAKDMANKVVKLFNLIQ